VEKTGLKEIPRAFLVSRFEVLDTEKVLEKTSQLRFDPRREVLLESDPGIFSSIGKSDGFLEVKDLDTDRIEVQARLTQPALLVVSDNYSRGWKARALSGSNQSSYRVMPANGFQRAVPLEAGNHHFLMEYRPTAYVTGKLISIFAWVIFLGLCAWKRPRFFPSPR
jgi:hypothetical protein